MKSKTFFVKVVTIGLFVTLILPMMVNAQAVKVKMLFGLTIKFGVP